MKKVSLFILATLFVISCREAVVKEDTDIAKSIIDDSILSSGGTLFENSKVEFTFRDKRYEGERRGGKFKLMRKFTDTIGAIVDTYTNEGFSRTIDNVNIAVADTMILKYEESINSVFYFAQLPYKLGDAAVIKKDLGLKEIKGKQYHKISVTFNEEGGGQDFDDNFIYWINTETKFIEYLAYNYATSGGGTRFRLMYNERIVEGMRFVDAINMKPKVKGSVKLEEIDDVYEAGELVELSRIILEEVAVSL